MPQSNLRKMNTVTKAKNDIKMQRNVLLLFGVVSAAFVLPRSPALLSVVEGLVTGTVATRQITHKI